MTNKRITFQNSVVVTDISLIRALNGVPGDMAVVASAEVHGSFWFDISDTTTSDDGRTCIVAVDGGRWKLVVLDADAVEYQMGSPSAYRDGSVGAALAGLESAVGVLDSAVFGSGGIADHIDAFTTYILNVASATGASLVGFAQIGGILRNLLVKMRETKSVTDYTSAQAAWNSLSDGGTLDFAAATSYVLTDTLSLTGKGRVQLRGNQQELDATGLTGPKPAVYFKGIGLSTIDGLFVIGTKAGVSVGAQFDADASNISIHVRVGKVHVSTADVAIQVGNKSGYQFSDSLLCDLYGADSNVGIRLTGQNTLAMEYQHLEAYNNAQIGVHFEQGAGHVSHLQVAASVSDIFFGQTDGMNHNLLNRWDISSGYSEEGVAGERFIDSVKCTDTNPYQEEVVFAGYRVTPFTSTNTADFIRWNLNGNLTLRNSTINHGQQLPVIAVDHNTAYTAPRVLLDECTITCSPLTAPQVCMTYTLTDPRQQVEINARVNNGMSAWNNGGSQDFGTIKRGIYMRKLREFEDALFGVASLLGAWNLRDLPSATCLNLLPGGASLTLSTALERRDFWLDDGLVGLYRNSTASKTLSTTSASFIAAAGYTFGCIMRPFVTGTDETNNNNVGGALGVRIGAGFSGSAFVRCAVGAVSASAVPTNPFDPHLVVGRYVSTASVQIFALNLRTGEQVSATNTTSIPAFGSLTWVNGVNLRNDNCVRGFPFVFSRAISDNEVQQLAQAALRLTDSWRLA